MGPKSLGGPGFRPYPYAMENMDFMLTAMTVSAVLVGLWQTTLSPEEKLDADFERYGSAAGLALFVVVAVAVKFLR